MKVSARRQVSQLCDFTSEDRLIHNSIAAMLVDSVRHALYARHVQLPDNHYIVYFCLFVIASLFVNNNLQLLSAVHFLPICFITANYPVVCK